MAISEREVKNKRNSNGLLTGRPGTVYDVNVKYYKNGKQKSFGKRGFPTRKEAQQFEAEMRLKLQNPTYSNVLRNEGKQKIKDYLTAWVERYGPTNLRPSTYSSYKGLIRNHIIPLIGNVRLNELTPEIIDGMLKQLFDTGLSQSTVRYCQRILSVSLGGAVKYHYIDSNPARDIITKFGKESHVPDPYTVQQMQQLLGIVAGTRLEFPVAIAGLYGLRISEILGLRWRNVCFESKQFNVIEQLPFGLPSGTHEVHEMAPVKGKSLNKGRKLPITDITMQYFVRQKEKQNQQKAMCIKSSVVYYDNDLVFAQADGSPIRRNDLSQQFGQVLRRSGMPHIRFHDLRHTAATNIHQLTGDFFTISEILGHTLEGTSKSFGFSAQVNTITAQYVEVRNERKHIVLETYHQAVLGGTEVTEKKSE